MKQDYIYITIGILTLLCNIVLIITFIKINSRKNSGNINFKKTMIYNQSNQAGIQNSNNRTVGIEDIQGKNNTGRNISNNPKSNSPTEDTVIIDTNKNSSSDTEIL